MNKILTFKCDTCKRTIEKLANNQGLDALGRCTITDGCKGFLHLEGTKYGFSVPAYPTPSATLQDFQPRKILYTHTQQLPDTVWIINHDLQNDVSVQTFVYNTEGELEELEPSTIDFVDENTQQVTFNQPYYGVAQCLVRSTTSDQKIKSSKDPVISLETENYIPISVNGKVVVASSSSNPSFEWKFTSPVTNQEITITTVSSAVTEAWNGVNRILINGLRYHVYEMDLMITVLASVDSGSYGYVEKLASPPTFSNKDTFVLLTQEPYTVYDRVFDKCIKLEGISSTDQPLMLIENEVNISSDRLLTIYPYIKIIS